MSARQDLRSVWGRAEDGETVHVAVPADLTDRLEAVWPPIGLAMDNTARAPIKTITVTALGDGLRVVVDGLVAGSRWERVESELALFASERLASAVAIHSAVILAGGRALLVPGPSRAGKSMLCLAADAAGAVVLSDEYALVDPATGEVTGWPRPVRERQADGTTRQHDLAVSSDPVPVGLVAVVRHDPDQPPALTDLAPSDTVMDLLANTVCAQSSPHRALDAALAVARSCPAVRGTRHEAGPALERLLERMARESR